MKTTTHLSANYFQAPKAVTQKEARKSRFLAALNKFWKAVTIVDTEPRVRQEYDRLGKSYWHVFDPTTDQDRYFDTEDEVCAWLEQRYYA